MITPTRPRPARRVAGGLGLALLLTLSGTLGGAVTAPPAVAASPPAATTPPAAAPGGPPGGPPGVPAPPGTREAAPGDAPLRWRPPLAGSSHAVEVTGGSARLDPARDGRSSSASLRDATRLGLLDLGTHRFGSEVNRFDVPVEADVPPGAAVETDVRGQRPDGRWTEWVPAGRGAPALLDEPAREVEARLVLTAAPGGAGPTVRSVEVIADRVAAPEPELAPRSSHRVFATREGLVGFTTANGHVIKPNDQFAALPSRRGLSKRGQGEYSVRVCTAAGRCATVPVWDVGPWNITDDYWNSPGVRQRWKDLPTGVPQAQAAFNDRYNGGRDGYGRQVKNPAGIDLADGTFWGLGLRDNEYVTVDYLWTTRSGPTGRALAPSGAVPLRAEPSDSAGDVGFVGDGARVDLECQVPGAPVEGPEGASSMWLRVAPGQYVPAAHMSEAPPVPPCAG